MKLLFKLIFVTITALFMVQNAALAAEKTMIVLDGSGSMWGQINGKPKLVIARETLREVLKTVPESTELGLMAYGHRIKGDCSDIELIVQPKAGTAGEIANRVDKLKFLGKTPLSEAVKQAAEQLRYTEDKATVILITDGIETCNADPCALGNSLEELGLDFTTHVVGFGLSKAQGKQVACLAENTGGKYLAAGNAAELVDALGETVAAIVPHITLIPIDQNGDRLKNYKLSWNVMDASGNTAFELSGSIGNISSIDAGEYSVSVAGQDVSGGGNFTVAEVRGNQDFEIPVELVILQASVEAPATAAAAAEFEVIWSGPDHQNDFVAVYEQDAKVSKNLDYAYTRKGSPGIVTAPDGAGVYEIRYIHGPSKKVLATTTIEITPISAAVEGPADVAASADFEVTWSGPNNRNDYIAIAEVGAKDGKYIDYAYTLKGSPAILTAPDGLGEYELRYVIGSSKRTLATGKTNVTAISATVEGPSQVGANADFEVTWSGPSNKNDYIAIAEVGAKDGKYIDFAYTRKGSPAIITAPDGLGEYELRYVIASSKRSLATSSVEVTAISATVEGPAQIPAGADFEVTWSGPANKNDYIAIAEVGAKDGKYIDFAYTRKGSPAILTAPDAVGDYELRYVVANSKRTLVSVTTSTTDISASLVIENNPTPGGDVVVRWEGPNYNNDYITIVEIGAPAKKTTGYAYTKHGNPAKFKAPKALGKFEVRYILSAKKRILASVEVMLKPVSARVTAPDKVQAGEPIEVSWTGPASKGDAIEIVAKGAADNANPISKAGTIQGSPLFIYAPEDAGEYEYRYKKLDTGKVLARAALLVE